MSNDKVISVLNSLIETGKDGEEGFKVAADGLKSADIKSRFLDFSRQRAQMVRDLQDEVRRLGGDPEKGGSVAGSLHRGWMNIRSVVTGKDEHAILAEAERGEDTAKSAFETALKEQLPAAPQALVQRYAAQVKQVHDEVRALRDHQPAAR